MMTELILILRTIVSLSILELFQRSFMFCMHQMSSIGRFFTVTPRIDFKNGKILKNLLVVSSVLPKIDVAGNSGPCGGKRLFLEFYKLTKKTSIFKSKNLRKFITFTSLLIVIPKAQYILQNVINVGNNAMVVLKITSVIEATIIKLLTENLKSNLKPKIGFLRTL